MLRLAHGDQGRAIGEHGSVAMRQRGEKAQPGGSSGEIGRLAIDRHQAAPDIAVEARHRGHQAQRVGMARVL